MAPKLHSQTKEPEICGSIAAHQHGIKRELRPIAQWTLVPTSSCSTAGYLPCFFRCLIGAIRNPFWVTSLMKRISGSSEPCSPVGKWDSAIPHSGTSLSNHTEDKHKVSPSADLPNQNVS